MEYTKNTDPNYFIAYPEESNCGSYALNVEEWYDPESELFNLVGYINEWIDELYDMGYSVDEIADIYAEKLVEKILSDFEGEIREIYYPSEVDTDEELIAFRGWCYVDIDNWVDYDFHFKVFRDGFWKEKCGHGPVRFCTEDDWSYGFRTYNSETIYFAHKIN